MNKVLLVTICALMVFGAATAQAYDGRYGGGGYERGERHGDIRERMHETAERIRRGMERGSISEQEAHRLFDELHGIREQMERMRDFDGPMGRDEQRARIDHELDRLNRQISHAMHDGERRYDGR